MTPVSARASYGLAAMIREFLKTHSVRELVLDPAGWTAFASMIAYGGAYAVFKEPVLTILESASLVLFTIPLTCLGLLAIFDRVGDDEFVIFLKRVGAYNALQLQFAYYKAVCLLAVIVPLLFYFVRNMPGSGAYTWITASFVVGIMTWSLVGTAVTLGTRQRYNMLRDRMTDLIGPK